ncbi:hypothetical protein Tco_0726828 [Tanacetum coccineum]|uniref:Reverse transcriptase domain-containing protein n=1 Tax=Tanacetum coccineum TaxID=301880 RepID=A0ABQ4YJ77_9ASTR
MYLTLKKCYADEPFVVLLDGLHIDDKLYFVEEPAEIMDREVKRLKQIRILIVKVRWNSRRGPKFTWEREDQFRKKIVTESVSESAKGKKTMQKFYRVYTIQDTPRPASKVKTTAVTYQRPSLKVILEWGDEQDSEFSDDDNDDVKKDDKDGDADDEGDDHVNDTQDADDEDHETESDEDEIYRYTIRVCKDKDVEMKDAEVEESDKGKEKVTDLAKEEAENTSEAKDDTKKTEHPPSSSSLSVSSGFGDQFLKLSSDSSLVSTVKDSVDTYVSSLLDIPI